MRDESATDREMPPPPADQIDRLQDYLRHAVSEGHTVVPIPPFTAYFHPTDAFSFFNYAIPDVPVGGDLSGVLTGLRALFRARDRQPRFEYLEEFAPDLAASLEANGFG